MLIGYNNDVKYQGLTFHIQTEDRGSGNDQSVESQLFQGGQILDTRITPYADLVKSLNEEDRDKKIRAIMQASHKGLFRKLRSGEYNTMVGLEPVESVVEEINDADFTPSQERVPDEARLVEQEGEAAFNSPNIGDHVDLAALKSKLAGLAGTSELNVISEAEINGDDEAVDNLFEELKSNQAAVTTAGEKSTSKVSKQRGASSSSSADSDEPMTIVLDAKTLSDRPAKAMQQKVSTALDSEKPAALSPAIQAARAAAARLASPNSSTRAAETSLVDFEPTGKLAWTGCEPANQDISLLTLVEAFLHG